MDLKENINNFSDVELLSLIEKTGDITYIGVLFKKYSTMLLGFSMNYLKDEATAKDAVMDVFEIVLLEIKKGKIKNFKSWLFTVTRNYCFKLLKEKRPILDYNEAIEENGGNCIDYEVREKQDKQEEQLVQLEIALTQLKTEHKKCLILFYYKNKSYKEIAAITGFDIKKVKSYIQNGKRNLGNLILARATQ